MLDTGGADGLSVFDPPLPLLRVPRGGGNGEPSSDSLRFRSSSETAKALQSCKATVASRCEEGARAACVVEAVKHCRPRWTQRIFGPQRTSSSVDECEEGFVSECMQRSATQCSNHSVSFCEQAFQE